MNGKLEAGMNGLGLCIARALSSAHNFCYKNCARIGGTALYADHVRFHPRGVYRLSNYIIATVKRTLCPIP